jgi:hypothetical protein
MDAKDAAEILLSTAGVILDGNDWASTLNLECWRMTAPEKKRGIRAICGTRSSAETHGAWLYSGFMACVLKKAVTPSSCASPRDWSAHIQFVFP